jgi:hypothetical protein
MLDKSKRKQEKEILLRCIIMPIFLINYLPPPGRFAKGYNKHFFRIHWSP